MPRAGGASDNGPFETGEHLTHGSSGDPTIQRAQKTAPMPEHEKGGALEGMNASGGGGSVGTGSGKGAPPEKMNKGRT
ncbi:uncharacterized protein EI97DRAFT_454677 [Westerdykella ornata]|uniref:Uncharacterized protein n=1 Tax=Westerdykella ornata TaxID=318751 RepID=A0A6A6JXZ7_WESOR|nr:uncharacterized protein EI97DRAFT_454677 [Westerdykella ornata]KAF2281490.1 hypothetical protein EI97DRAFT_454677 [Westerdykella ornata]